MKDGASFHWHAVAGNLMKSVLESFNDINHPTEPVSNVLVLAITLEAVRVLTAYGLARSRDADDPDRCPTIQDLCNDEYSPGIAMLQYLAAVQDGTAPVLRLLFGAVDGCENYGQFEEACPQIAKALRTATSCVSAWVERRWVEYYKQVTSELAAIADHRHKGSFKFAVARKFAENAQRCDHCIGRLGVSLKNHNAATVEALTSPAWMRKIWVWSFSLNDVITIADMERGHRLTKLIAKSDMAEFKNIASSHYNAWTNQQWLADRAATTAELQRLPLPRVGDTSTPTASHERRPEKQAKGLSARELFNMHCIREAKDHGNHF